MGYRVDVKNWCLSRALPDVGKVFEQFYKDGSVLAENGSRLSLYIVRELVHSLDGAVGREDVAASATVWIELGEMP